MPFRPDPDPEWVFARRQRHELELAWLDDGWDRQARMDPDHWSTTALCPVCGRGVAAQETCVACGDVEEMAA